MHITDDVSIGTIITIFITLAGFLVAAGRTSALLSQATRYISDLRSDFNDHVSWDAKRFDSVTTAITDAAIKQAAVAATVSTMSTTVSAMAAAQLSARTQDT